MAAVRFALSLALVAWLGAPALAAPVGYQVPMVGAGASAHLTVTPPLAGHYVCPMDPEVHADESGTCPQCHMDLELAPTKLRFMLDAAGPAMPGRKVRLAVAGHPDFARVVRCGADGSAEASFALPPGTYTLSAELDQPGTGKHLVLTAPYHAR